MCLREEQERVMTTLIQDIRYGLRTLIQAPGFAGALRNLGFTIGTPFRVSIRA